MQYLLKKQITYLNKDDIVYNDIYDDIFKLFGEIIHFIKTHNDNYSIQIFEIRKGITHHEDIFFISKDVTQYNPLAKKYST